jgi:hypothetical protein
MKEHQFKTEKRHLKNDLALAIYRAKQEKRHNYLRLDTK